VLLAYLKHSLDLLPYFFPQECNPQEERHLTGDNQTRCEGSNRSWGTAQKRQDNNHCPCETGDDKHRITKYLSHEIIKAQLLSPAPPQILDSASIAFIRASLVCKKGFKISGINHDDILISFQDQEIFIAGNYVISSRIDSTSNNHIIIGIPANI
jgi:hypothetical protein